MRILGLDVGEKRIGVALSDILGITAQGITVIQRENPGSDIERLKKLVAEHGVKEVVVGVPLNLNGTVGPKAAEILSFMDRLRQELDVSVKRWDERLSTVSAERVLIQGKVRRMKRRRVIDKLAGQIILQSYLDARTEQVKNDD